MKEDLTLRNIQNQLPWTIKYSRDFHANPQSHKDFAHALTHVLKAAGKLAATVDDLDHRRESQDEYEKYIADLVICALRMANTAPIPIDLHSAVINRLESKNEIKLHHGCHKHKSTEQWVCVMPLQEDESPSERNNTCPLNPNNPYEL